MAWVVVCPECRKDVPDGARVCPGCGCPVRLEVTQDFRQRGSKSESAGFLLILLGIPMCLASGIVGGIMIGVVSSGLTLIYRV